MLHGIWEQRRLLFSDHSHHYFEKMIDGRLWLIRKLWQESFWRRSHHGSYGNRQWKLECQKNQFFCIKTNIYLLLDDLSRFYRTLNMRYSQYKKQMFGKHVRYKGRKPRWSTQQMQKEEFTGREKSRKEESQEIFQYHGDGIRGDRYNRDHDHGCDGFETGFSFSTGLPWHLALWYYIQV